MNKDNGKILLATLAGIGAGVAAGMLLAPDSGKGTLDTVKRTLTKTGDDLNNIVKRWTESLKSGEGNSEEDDQLVMHGSWEDVKGQLRQNYDELTEEDLEYQEGGEQELLGRLQRRLGKTKDEIMHLISGK
ncbi:CsbD family protein [Pontibacter silvestris]|uniref:CsbD family protein n=1 Tax=Pontibacter silvestris TaxID=2305183 RepID=A0ABW4WVL5_9BACT|nr:CsbD family protein [Pontibacter silvestris]MCC9138065.1 CsbD family protein [Pontibacter silvestris]